MSVTEWFPGDVRPVHAGVYQRKIFGEMFFAMWDGGNWRSYCKDFGNANAAITRSLVLDADWRGLTGE